MKLEYQVCSLELAKKLKELGVPQESNLIWVESAPFFDGNFSERDVLLNPDQWLDLIDNTGEDYETYAAFSVADLGALLPYKITFTDQKFEIFDIPIKSAYLQLWVTEEPGDYYSVKRIYTVKYGAIFRESYSEAEARASMLIYLLENNLVSFPS